MSSVKQSFGFSSRRLVGFSEGVHEIAKEANFGSETELIKGLIAGISQAVLEQKNNQECQR